MALEETTKEHTQSWRPFYHDGWSSAQREAAQALWKWHQSLREPIYPALDGPDLTAYFEAEREKAEAAEPLHVVPEDVWKPAYQACREQDLPHDLLALQVAGARQVIPPVRFDNRPALQAFLRRWTFPHGRLLAQMADAAYTWQLPLVDELIQGFFLTGRLVYLPREMADDRVFFPRSEREQYGVSLEGLQAGRLDEGMRRFMWKQIVRARDHFGQGHALLKDLSGRRARALRRWWMRGMELLAEIERRNYDVWSEPLEISRWQRWRIQGLALIGRTQMRSR